MNFGVLLIIRNPQKWQRPLQDVYRGYLDNAVLSEKLGFSHIWTSEHHFTVDAWSPAQLPILAALSQRTDQIRLGTLILVLPLHNPIRAAEDAATVDIISNGRLDFACGPGGRLDDYAGFGIPVMQRRSRMYEGLEIVKRCFTEEQFSFKGKYWEFNNVRMTTKPVQKPCPLWVAALGPKALEEAGTKGYHLASTPPAQDQKIYDDALRRAGHDPKKFQRAMHRMVHVAETTDKAWDEAEEFLHYYATWQFAGMERRQAMGQGHESVRRDLTVPPVGELRKSDVGPYGAPYIGSPEDVIRKLDGMFRECPMTEMAMTPGFPGMDPKIARKSMELFAKEIIPHFKNKYPL